MTTIKDNRIFEPDEMNLKTVDPQWKAEDLLRQDGIFFLKDIAHLLNLEPNKVKKRARALEDQGKDPRKLMGAYKIWSHWMVRMTVFAPYFRKHLVSSFSRVDPKWDGNTLLQQKGVFLLTDVCRKIPFTTHQIRYQAKAHPRSKEELGVWKDRKLGNFVVDMERFASWIYRLWGGGFQPGHRRKNEER